MEWILLKRIVIYCIALVGAYFAVYCYYLLKTRQLRAELRAQAANELAATSVQRKALDLLGDVNLDPYLTAADLIGKLHRADLRLPGAKSTTRFGWACARQSCAISASFLIPFGQDVPSDATPAAVMLAEPAFTHPHLAIGGIYLGEPIGEMQNSCQSRGFGDPIGKNRISWDKNWNMIWVERDGKIIDLVFVDRRKFENSFDKEKGDNK